LNYQKISIATFPEKYNQQDVWWWFFEALSAFDADGDGDADILVMMTGAIWDPLLPSDPKPYLIENLGENRFKLSSPWTGGSPSVLGWVNNVVIGDFNTDGINDVLVVDHGREDKPYELRDFAPPILYLSSKDGWVETSQTIQPLTDWTVAGRDFWHGVINSRDFNGDGHLDLVMTALGRAGVELWLGDGRGNFSNESRTYLPGFIDRTTAQPDGSWSSFGIAGFVDAGGDGKQDIFMLPYAFSATNSNGYVVLNPASQRGALLNLGNLAKDPSIANNLNRGYSEALVFDFDGNGLEDILAIAEASNGKQEGVMYLMYLSQEAPFEFFDRTIESFGSYSSWHPKVTPRGAEFPDLFFNTASTEFYLGDYNGDGFMDVNLGFSFLGEWDALGSTIYVNNGAGKFSRSHSVNVIGETSSYQNLRTDGVGDLNKDGYADFLVISQRTVNGLAEYDVSVLISQTSEQPTTFLGTELSGHLVGNSRNNTFIPHPFFMGNSYIDGKGGVDTVFYSGPSEGYRVQVSTDSAVVGSTTYPTKRDTLHSVERIVFSDKAIALDTEAVGGQAYRVYKAAFNREPDQGGLGYWIAQMDSGMTLIEAAARFIDSNEFRAMYGTSPTDEQYLTKVYQNVLGRDPEPDGYNWWLNEIRTNPDKTRAKVLADFSESLENKAGTAQLVGQGIVYEPWMG